MTMYFVQVLLNQLEELKDEKIKQYELSHG